MPASEDNRFASHRRASVFAPLLHAPRLTIGLAIILGMGVGAVVLGYSLGLDPFAVDPLNRLEPPSAEHLLGTDNFGRDLMARLLAGAKTSLSLAASVTFLAAMAGAGVGIAASSSRFLDQILMRTCDGLMAIPTLLLAVALTATFGPNFTNLLIALVIVSVPGIARLVRARALALQSETFVEAARAMGAGGLHIMVRHIFPNVLSVLAVQATFVFADTIVIEAALSFLGAGVPPPAPSWGNILYDGKSAISKAPWMVLFASLAIVFTVIGLTLAGDGLRDLTDPRMRQRRRSGFAARLAGIGRTADNDGEDR